ncbi:MAG: serine/threonine-protein kinase [Gemmatimonadaceae bacterium]
MTNSSAASSAADDWERVTELLDDAMALAPEQRDAWFQRLSASDAHLRDELISLIASFPEADKLFEAPASAWLSIVERVPALTVAQRFGSWSLVRELGRGGMGSVWEAERVDADFAQRAALKVVRAAIDSSPLRQRFRQERRLLALLKHRNIATLLDGGVTTDGTPWFAMELVDGEPITRWCDERKLAIDDRINLLRQVCGAVQHAHRALIVHRDLKPGNILVTSDGTVKLLDFGIAKVIDDANNFDQQATQPGSLLGTPAYLAPEILHGEPASTSADIYAIGVISYELLSGRLPFPNDSGTSNEWRKIVLQREPLALSESLTDEAASVRGERNARGLQQKLQGDIERIVSMALRKEPDRRYTSVEQLGEDLRRSTAGLPVIAQVDSVQYRVNKFVNRNRAAVIGAAATLVVLIAGLVGTTWQARVARHERDRALLETAKVSRVRAFMEETFRAADPRSQGKDVTVAQALAVAELRADSLFKNEPEVKSALLASIGRTYLGLGKYDDASRTLHEALVLARTTDNGRSADVTEGIRSLAMLEAERGKIPDAESLFVEALSRANKQPVDSATLGSLLDGFGSLQLDKGDFSAAEMTLRNALAVRQSMLGARNPEIAGTLNNLAVSLGQQNRWTEAIPLHENALNILRAAKGDEHPDVATGLNTLANAYTIIGRFPAADTMFKQALALRVRLLGAHHPEVAWTHYSYADMLRLSGDFSHAIEQAKEVLAERGSSLPESHPMISSALIVQGRSLLSLSRPEEAEAPLRESLRLRSAAYAAGHWLIASGTGAVGECLLAEKKFDAAEPLLTSAYRDMIKTKGLKDQRTRELGVALASLYDATGRKSQAEGVRAEAR